MALSVSKLVPTATNNIAREIDQIYRDLHELDDFISIEGPKILEKKDSLHKEEKQISVDPMSLIRESKSSSSSMGEVSFNMMFSPINAPQEDSAVPLPPPLLPAKQKFLTNDSSNGGRSSRKNNFVNYKHSSSAKYDYHQYYSSATTMQKSKSCGEGRNCSPPDEFDDLWLYDAKSVQYKNITSVCDEIGRNRKTNSSGSGKKKKMVKNFDCGNNSGVQFKCSVLCLFIPGFGNKPKQARPRKAEQMVMIANGNYNYNNHNSNVISRSVSLEKFECGSWASSTIISDHDEDAESMNLYFDLPLELIKNLGTNDAHLPVSAAFVFDKKDIKGVLKNGSRTTAAAARKSHESNRHVRFSTSSPTTSYPASPAACISPRLRKAREDFNALLEAQSA